MTTNEKTIIGMAVAGVTGLVLLLNSYTIVQSGTVKVQKLFGKVKATELQEGFHFVNPLADFTTYDVKEQAFELNDLQIPTEDKLKSSVDISIMYRLSGANAPKLLQTVGTQNSVLYKAIQQPILSLARESGKGVKVAQDLFKDEVQSAMQDFLTTELVKATAPYGITITNVFIKDVSLPHVIDSAVKATKEREEEVAQQRAKLEKEALVYDRQIKEAESKAKAAEQQKIAMKHKADAEYYTRQQEANAKLYLAKKEAEGNKVLARSVTANLLALKDKEIALTQANRWTGNVPQTVLGDSPIPLWNVNK